MRVKCLAQEHNGYVVPQPGIEPGQFDPKSSALIIRPPASHNAALCFNLCRAKLTCETTHLHSYPHGGKAEHASQQHILLHQRIRLLRKNFSFLFSFSFFLSYIIFVDLWTQRSTYSTHVWLNTSAHDSFLMGCMCMFVYLVGVCALPLLNGLHLFGVNFHI